MMLRLTLLLLLLLTAAPAWSTTYYVSISGDNANSCTTAQSSTATNAKRNIANGIACMTQPGDVLRIHASGTAYTDATIATNTTDIINGTSYANATIIESYNGTVTWNHTGTGAIRFQNSDQYIIVRAGPNGASTFPFIIDGTNGSTFNFALIGANTHHIKFEGLEIRNATASAIYADLDTTSIWYTGNYFHDNGTNTGDHHIYQEGDSALIEHNRFATVTGYGLHFYNGHAGSGGLSSNHIVRYNDITGSATGGAIIDGTNNQIYHNIFRANIANGMTCGFSPGSDSNLIANNTFHGATGTGYGIQIGLFGNCTNLTVTNNSFSSNAGECVRKESGTTSGTADQNNCNGNGANTITGLTSTNLSTVAPDYINAGTADFGLQSTSTLIDAGTASAPVGLPSCNGTCDIGAHETIGSCSAIVPDTAGDNTMVISCTNNKAPPLLPAGSTCSGFSATRAGSPNAITACNRTGQNEITLTLQDAYSSGNSATFSYSTTTGNVSDSALIGGTKNQRLNSTAAPVTATNQVDGSTPTLTQVSFLFECPGGTQASPDCRKPLNTGVTIPPGEMARVRLLVGNTVADAGSFGFTLCSQKNGSGGYTALANGPPTSTGISFITGTGRMLPELTAGVTTEQMAGSGTFVAGGVLLSALEVPNVTLTAGQDTELVGALAVGDGNSVGDFFDIRACKPGGVALNAHTQTPRITVGGYIAVTGNR